MLPLVIIAYWKAFGCIIFGLLSFLRINVEKLSTLKKHPNIGIRNIIFRLEKSTEMNYGSYFCFFLVSYDSLYSNESFLLVDFGFQGRAPYNKGLPSRECVNFRV